MSSRTRARVRTQKVPAGATTVRIPRQRRAGHRQSAPVIVVVPERPSLTARAAAAVGVWAWEHRRAWAPTAAALVLFLATGIVHLLAAWVGLVLAGAAIVPLGWLAWVTKFRPTARRSVLKWRAGLTLAVTTVTAWMALAVAFSPVAGPLGWLWLLLTLTAQSVWLYSRRTPTAVEEIH
ncbi:hypothetical protein [Streptomyces mirabilis]|uniref:hypothetical protein n=1 Tax=Streptomyces mirabilis TaxID=68239 RepID=UPI003698EE11